MLQENEVDIISHHSTDNKNKVIKVTNVE